ncbi:MAG: 2-C-methyl-D-erythritol 4-phosphate cytidylyltransferase [Clostridia bacterium]|nr:2-C-methyl-D-erythritol 4-phosphate cytidylyltransferase [Clostridia bacterium]
MKAETTKQCMSLLGESVLKRAVSAFDLCDDISSIVVVIREDERQFVMRELSEIKKLVCVVVGGKTRAESARIGFLAIPEKTDFVAIHDAARCLITPEMITDVLSDAIKYGAATAATPAVDTVKIIDNEGFVEYTPKRALVMMASTPQIFSVEIYKKALSCAEKIDDTVTDDNMLVEMAGYKVFCTDVGKENIKITVPGDIQYAEHILKGREK